MSFGEVFVINKDGEIPFEKFALKKKFKKDISQYLLSTEDALKKVGESPYQLALIAAGPSIAGSIGIGPWQIGGNVSFYVLFVHEREEQ